MRNRSSTLAASPVKGLVVPKACVWTSSPSLATATDTVSAPRPNSDDTMLASKAANGSPARLGRAWATPLVGA